MMPRRYSRGVGTDRFCWKPAETLPGALRLMLAAKGVHSAV